MFACMCELDEPATNAFTLGATAAPSCCHRTAPGSTWLWRHQVWRPPPT